MFRKAIYSGNFAKTLINNSFSNVAVITNKEVIPTNSNVDKSKEINSDLELKEKLEFEIHIEDLNEIDTYLKPTFNFASYINKSPILQEFFKLGVDLYKFEKNQDVAKFILSLNYENDVHKFVEFFNDLNISHESLGKIITKNPYILKENIEDLVVRINYLKCKKFTPEMITRIVESNPFWLSYTTQQIDQMLGFFQKHFTLKGDEVRSLTVTCPKLITFKERTVKVNTFAIHEEMGFSTEEVKGMLLKKPKLFMRDQRNVLKTFEYLHNEMNISLDQIVDEPGVLTCRCNRLRERHKFLKKLERDQFDPKKPMYVSLTTLVSSPDADFATEVAKSSVQIYNEFLKSI
ncbi:unnamed protein product [Brassicogethes aeneus]|uniref:mTERF domain-containing protein 1, mitochondrial n=1 Tax=Brassicogethes aeneus TaxID=1431903 RepID=A0A9P0B8U3_BRAAE|nr:unnamed protein product [Brassicogethes aeneus]